MKKLDSRYIIGVLWIALFILIGIIEFIWKGSRSFTFDEIYFRVPIIVSVMIEMIPSDKNCGMFRVLFLLFLSDYLLQKFFDFLEIEVITLTLMPYLIILGILLIIFSARLIVKSKQDISTRSKKEK
ncbi:hypothetical protein [Enterococcus ratti]|nr:hypothetical protein [Enterococcus ratti]